MTQTVKKPVSMKKTILRLLLYFVVLDVCVITLYPYFAMLCTALKSREEIFSGGTVLPITDTWSNCKLTDWANRLAFKQNNAAAVKKVFFLLYINKLN